MYNESLAIEISGILTEKKIESIGDQMRVCRKIADTAIDYNNQEYKDYKDLLEICNTILASIESLGEGMEELRKVICKAEGKKNVTIKLKPCPNCGNNTPDIDLVDAPGLAWWRAHCRSCGIETEWGASKQRVIDWWNSRTK